MKKSELIPYKHVLMSRGGDIYWYVGDEFCTEETSFDGDDYMPKSFICLSPNVGFSSSNNFLLENLLANRDGYWSNEIIWGKARKNDIIYVTEILNNYKWLDFIRKHDYIKNLGDVNRWTSSKILKLVWERIDCEMEEN